ncbi:MULTISPECIES: hypothetical protein [Geminicoccus]|uniref:hypothetical protein n=1 Tax=Geminicoccus TaxID=489140 RepID=UPI00135C3A4C|nr:MULTISPECIES: hypothetical protein [Geminicoccus]
MAAAATSNTGQAGTRRSNCTLLSIVIMSAKAWKLTVASHHLLRETIMLQTVLDKNACAASLRSSRGTFRRPNRLSPVHQ